MKTYTARSPLDLIALAPYVLGFHPEDSVVLMTFGGGQPFHARVDLPDNAEEQEAVAAMLRGVVVEHAVPHVAVLVYSEDVEAAAAMGELLVTGFLCDGVDVIDVLRVEDQEYFDAIDTTLSGAPYDLSTHPFTASRVYDGKVAHDSRAALADSLVGTDEDDRAAVHQAADRFADDVLATSGMDSIRTAGDGWAGEQCGWLAATLDRALVGPRRLSAAESGQLLVLLTQVDLRDTVWWQITGDNARAHVDLWSDLVRRAPDDLLPAPAALLAFAAWQVGDGALAWCALDRCTAVDPDYRLAELVADVLARAVPPSAWAELKRQTAAEDATTRRAG